MNDVTLPEAVVFDLGKVLLDFDYHIAVERLQAHCQSNTSELLRLINQSPLLLEYESGSMSSLAFFERIKAIAGFRGDFRAFKTIFGDIFTPIESMIQLQAQLRSTGIATYIFSNTNELAVEHIRSRFPFFTTFNGYIYSYEHRLMKPDPRLYAVVEQVSGKTGAQLFYLDDRLENIAAGAARGWQTCLHETSDKSRQALNAMGLLRGK